MSGGEEEDSPVDPMQVGDDFCNYISIRMFSPGPLSDLRRPLPLKKDPRTRADTGPTFGILDLNPHGLVIPPAFSERETLEAMNRLGYVPEDLTVAGGAGVPFGNEEIRNRVFLELDRRRLRMIAKVIAERNRIVSGANSPPLAPAAGTARRHRKRKAKRMGRKRAHRKKESPADEPGRRPSDEGQRKMEADLANRQRELEARLIRQKQKRTVRITKRKAESKARQAGVEERRRRLDEERIEKAQEKLKSLDRVQQKIEKARADKAAAFRAKRDKERRGHSRPSPKPQPARKTVMKAPKK
jgi:hypothetical protein